MTNKSLLFIFIVIAFSGRAQTPDHISKDYKLVWSDEFDGHQLDRSKWQFRATGSNRGGAIVDTANVSLDGEGHLIIKATKDSIYRIGQISTYYTYQIKYGYFESRIKLSNQKGVSTAFWLQSPKYGKFIGDVERSGAEIDIMEYRRKYRTDEIHHTVHWDGYGEDHEQHGKSPIHKGIDEGFHTFGLEWTENKYTFYVDGKKSWATRKAVSQIKQYVILSVEMNEWSGDPSESTFPDQAIYDYVRIYQMK